MDNPTYMGDVAAARTWEFVFKPTAMPLRGDLIGNRYTLGYLSFGFTAGQFSISVYNNQGASSEILTHFVFYQQRYHMVLVGRAQSDGFTTWDCWIDGVLRGSISSFWRLGDTATEMRTDIRPFEGEIDLIRVYSQSLSAEQASSLSGL